ncbi:MAG: hypothetical protein RIR73_1635 [Chloroflexota bacterium]
MKKEIFSGSIFYVVIIVYTVLGYMTLGWGDQVASVMVREDQYFESIGALMFFVASIFFFLAFWNIRNDLKKSGLLRLKPLILLGFAIAFFFGGGEEISWGQRIFNIATPDEINAINDQGEITVHNLDFGGVNIPFETIFDLLWVGFAFALPFSVLFIKPFGQFIEKYIPISHWGIGLLFAFNYLWAKAAKVIHAAAYTYDRVPFQQAVQEVKESNYALLFALVAFFLYLVTRESVSSNSQKV